MKDIDLLDMEMQIWAQSQNYHNPQPRIVIDRNWELLKQERSLPPESVKATVDRVSNVSIILWANKNYTDGNFQCDVYRQGQKSHYNKNLNYEVLPALKPQHYKIWDLVITDSVLNDCEPKRMKLYSANNVEDYDIDFSHFQIWKNNRLVWACLLVEEWIIPMTITMDEFQQSGNIRLTAPWKHRQSIDDFYKNNI